MQLKKKRENIIFQDGANNVVKHIKSAMEIFDELTNLVENYMELFESNVLLFLNCYRSKMHPETIPELMKLIALDGKFDKNTYFKK